MGSITGVAGRSPNVRHGELHVTAGACPWFDHFAAPGEGPRDRESKAKKVNWQK